MEGYREISFHQDRLSAALQAAGPRAWLLLGLVGLGLGFVAGAEPTPLAIAVGGVVLASRAFRALSEATERLATAWNAWEHVRTLAGNAEGKLPAALSLVRAKESEKGSTVLEARNVVCTYPGRLAPVLDGVSLRVLAGDRLLIEGPSGSGKSTLTAILAGMRQPTAGLVLLGGLGPDVLGADGWRERVVIVPPFHDNHILQGTLAFNLLMVTLAANSGGCARGGARVSRVGTGAVVGADARRVVPARGRNRLATQSRRAQPGVPGACLAAGRGRADPRRELCRPGRADIGAGAEVRVPGVEDADRRRSPVKKDSRKCPVSCLTVGGLSSLQHRPVNSTHPGKSLCRSEPS